MTITTATPASAPLGDTAACKTDRHCFADAEADRCACGQVKNTEHIWVSAAIVKITAKTAKHANLRGSFRTAADQRIDSLEVYCRDCRRPYDDVADRPCEAREDNTHLIGGDPGVRQKRKVYAPSDDAEIIDGPPIQRRGTAAVVAGGSL